MSNRLSIMLAAILLSACSGQESPQINASAATSQKSSVNHQSSSSPIVNTGSQNLTVLPLLTIDVMSKEATLKGPFSGEGYYDLLISSDRDCKLETYSLCPNVQWIKNINLPYAIKGLKNGLNYWGQLFKQGKVISKNTGFRPDVIVANNPITEISVDRDGRYLAIGGFYNLSTVGPRTGPGIIVDENTGQPGAFPIVDGDINSVISDEKGGWYIGGSFSSVAGISRHNIAHIDAKGQVTAFNPDINGPIHKMALTTDAILILGNFNEVNLNIRENFVGITFDGKLLDWNLDLDGGISDFTLANNTVYLVGGFKKINQTARLGLASIRYKGELTNWNPIAKSGIKYQYISAIALDQGIFYFAGRFKLPGQEFKEGLAAFDSEGKLVNFSSTISGTVSTIAPIGDNIYISGYFYNVNDQPQEFLASLTKTGQLNNWNPDTNAPARSIQSYKNRIYMAGDFDSLFGQRRSKFAALNMDGSLSDWNPKAATEPNGFHGNNFPIFGAQVAFWEDQIYLASNQIDFFGGVSRENVFMLNQDGTLADISNTPMDTIFGRVDIKQSDTYLFENNVCRINLNDFEHLYSEKCPKKQSGIGDQNVFQFDDATAVIFQPFPQPNFETQALVIPRNGDMPYIKTSPNKSFNIQSIGGIFNTDEIFVTEEVKDFISTYFINRQFTTTAGATKKIDFNHRFNDTPKMAVYFNNRVIIGGHFSKVGEANMRGLAAFTKEGILIKSVKFPEINASVTDIEIRGNILYAVLDRKTTTTIDLSQYPDLMNP